MIFSNQWQRLNLAVLFLVICLHIASIAAAHYVFSHADGKSAAMQPLIIELATDARPAPKPETPATAMNVQPNLPMGEKWVAQKTTAAAKELAPAIKTDPTAAPEAQRDQKAMPNHVGAVSAAAAELTVATAAPAAEVRTSVSIPASYATSNRKPDYPKLSQRFGEQGTTVLRVLVQSDGSAGEVQIRKSSGYELLDTSARTAIRSWRFSPATSDGKAIAEWYEISIPFRLQD